ncbi:MAG TPA: LacI family DNA-binding transcriptional regulator [Candidatus Blautia pullicola]|uniref:LacI family DNA-binding transcriptional regulator n=1 Tax=Candidatus Blautia pullicola TaxID=2838498 RepID=A0A9D2FNI4_9FIRM|nr:LacI family DNA-binding transcriptional regulator [Candidatus Blautia pullicola]
MAEVKMKDIAAAVGVSVVTVSNALSGRKGVSEDVRQLVEKTARDMGYNQKKPEKPSQSGVIGVIASEKYITVGNSFYWAMYQNVVYEASKLQSVTMLEIVTFEAEEKEELPKLMRERAISGLIIIGWMSKSYVEKIVGAAGVPIVLLDFQMKGIRCDAVMSSNYVGMYKMTRYLLDRGHKEIAFVGSIRANENIMDRYYGYKKAMMEAGAREWEDWVLEDRDLVEGLSRVEIPKHMPTAFVCNSDWAAGLLYNELTGRGFRVPEDVSIVGYDNYLYGNPFAEKLTTYNVDMKQMARQAVKLLKGKMKGDDKYWGTRYIDSVVIERQSVKDLNM